MMPLNHPNAMLKLIFPMLLVFGFALSGCVSKHSGGSRHGLDEYEARLARVQNVSVPLPERTPYDSDPEARRDYLDFYRDGYRSALTGIHMTCCLGECPNREARVHGWYAGGRAAPDPFAPRGGSADTKRSDGTDGNF